MQRSVLYRVVITLTAITLLCSCFVTTSATADDLWTLAREKQSVHRFSTLFTAHNVRDFLATDDGIDQAIQWCKETAVTRVFMETFRSGYRASPTVLAHARDRFRDAGIEVSGCVTTTIVGKRSTGWDLISCYTDAPTQITLQKIFEVTASLFDEIMIDDFWFTDCECEQCDRAREAKTVTIGDETFPVSGDRWEDYRCELMLQLSRKNILEAAKRVNSKVVIINKFPQWYDNFHVRGYDVIRETEAFDRIWVGTETRDYDNPRWGGKVQYEAYFIMRWLGGIGGNKCGGGWYDPFGTTRKTYLEQARQTVLAGARESMLFCYGSLQRDTGPDNVTYLRQNIPELLDVAGNVRQRSIVGIAAYKPPSSHPENEKYVFDFAGMIGLPLVPTHEFPSDARAAFFSVHALKDPDIATKLAKFIAAGKPVLVTDGLADRLGNAVDLRSAPNVQVLPVRGQPRALLALSQDHIDKLRAPLLEPIGHHFHAPNKVALYLFDDGSWVIENFNDDPVSVSLDDQQFEVGARGWKYHWQ